MRNIPDKLNDTNEKDGRSSNVGLSKRKVKKIENKPISMHENVPVWYDCCSCEVEPYWLDAMEADSNKK